MISATLVNSAPGVVGLPRLILRAEALALLVSSVAAYHAVHGNWFLFLACFLAPDLAMLGYLRSPRVGAVGYNLAHTTVLYAIIGAAGYLSHQIFPLEIGLIGLAHIGFDRLAGYGLKYPEAFGFTHLGRIGKAAE